MNKIQLRQAILEQIEKPRIPAIRRSVLEFGGKPDSNEIQTETLQHAIDEISENGGGTLVLPAGRYRTGALSLKSCVEIHLESPDTVLSFVNEEPEKHYPLVFSHWEATPCYNYSPLIYGNGIHDAAVTGKGVLDGGADSEHWWNWHHQVENAWSSDKTDLQKNDRSALREMNLNGVPLEQRVFGPGHYLRPNFIQIVRGQRILLQDFTLKNSPMWQINPVMCESVTVDGVTMSSHGSNNDGCDPESCKGVHILRCRFDTGDDCISLKSGRDRDGRQANIPCEYVLIENNEFSDGHGGIALGSEMSGGIRCVLAQNNHFTSPNLTYALRLKTNAKRGGRVEDVILADSVMDHVHGAAVHGTMLYEDGRNGNDLPLFRNIAIENIRAHGGDYGIFLEAFDEVPITGLVLRNITIDGVDRPMRSMNWKNPVVENVVINGMEYPRPGNVRILGIPTPAGTVQGTAEFLGGSGRCSFSWEVSRDGNLWTEKGRGKSFQIPAQTEWVRLVAKDDHGNTALSRSYRVIASLGLDQNSDLTSQEKDTRLRLLCRGMLNDEDRLCKNVPVTREKLAEMMAPLATAGKSSREESALDLALREKFLAPDQTGNACPEGTVSRQEMATVAMQACGVNYRNASSTMPVCSDADQVAQNYGTNVARALYFGFMALDSQGNFEPDRPVTETEAAVILEKVADFAGI